MTDADKNMTGLDLNYTRCARGLCLHFLLFHFWATLFSGAEAVICLLTKRIRFNVHFHDTPVFHMYSSFTSIILKEVRTYHQEVEVNSQVLERKSETLAK